VGNGTIYFYDGSIWVTQASGTTNHLRKIYAFSATAACAVGDDGIILIWNGTSWVASSSGTSSKLSGVDGISATSIWAVGDDGTILHGIGSPTALDLTDLAFGEREYKSSWTPVKEAAGATQTALSTRNGGYYRQMAAGASEKFKWPLGAHRGRFLVSIGLAMPSTDAIHDTVNVQCYLETADGTRISPTSVTPAVVHFGNPVQKWVETSALATRMANLSFPSHFVPEGINENNVVQVVEVIAEAGGPGLWIDEISLIPVEKYVKLSSWSGNVMILDSTSKIVLSSIDGGLDTSNAFNPTKVEGAVDFYADPAGMNFTVLASKIATGDQQLTPISNVRLVYYPAYLLTAE
jgi:hypothetical protein